MAAWSQKPQWVKPAWMTEEYTHTVHVPEPYVPSAYPETTLRSAQADYLAGYHWDLFDTVTYRTPRIDAIRASDNVWRILSTKFDCTRAFIATEPHKSGELHHHAVLAWDLTDKSAFKWLPHAIWQYQFKAFGRNRVERIQSPELVSAYLSKYVTKPDGYDYSYYGDKMAWQK